MCAIFLFTLVQYTSFQADIYLLIVLNINKHFLAFVTLIKVFTWKFLFNLDPRMDNVTLSIKPVFYIQNIFSLKDLKLLLDITEPFPQVLLYMYVAKKSGKLCLIGM